MGNGDLQSVRHLLVHRRSKFESRGMDQAKTVLQAISPNPNDIRPSGKTCSRQPGTFGRPFGLKALLECPLTFFAWEAARATFGSFGADSTRDHLPNSSRTGGRASAFNRNASRSEPPHRKGHRLGQDELREAAPRGRSRQHRGHRRLDTAPPFSCGHRHESSSGSEATSLAGSARTYAHGWFGRYQCCLCCRIRERHSIQSRIQPSVRPTTQARYPHPPLTRRSTP
jgi:hypothetical protein